jgi:hypothetical protein
MLQSKDFRRSLFDRLHHLQFLYCEGKIARDSPEFSEILMLEELESIFVRRQMELLYEVHLGIFNRSKLAPERLSLANLAAWS